jgi:hypothetical protein
MREMSDTTTESHIIALKMRVRDLELQAVEVKARYEEALATLEMLEHPRRPRGRPSHGSHPRNVSAINPVTLNEVSPQTPEPETAA